MHGLLGNSVSVEVQGRLQRTLQNHPIHLVLPLLLLFLAFSVHFVVMDQHPLQKLPPGLLQGYSNPLLCCCADILLGVPLVLCLLQEGPKSDEILTSSTSP